MPDRPNVVIIMTDQQRADLTAREGYALDTTPFIDSFAKTGVDFSRAYTSMPICGPARVSMFTGRFPSATRVRTNHNIGDATYEKDLVDLLKEAGYAVGLSGKNHSHIGADRWDFLKAFGHGGGSGDDRTPEEVAFDEYLQKLRHRTHMDPTPHAVECQNPYRIVSHAQKWIESLSGAPFFLWMSIPEPHNPYQAPEPYYSMFPPESLPKPRSDEGALERKGYRWQRLRSLWDQGVPEYERERPRARANYHGMLRLIDDQVQRFLEYLDASGLRENTIVIYMTDHGDFVGEYGLIRKGPELPEQLTRIPMIWSGPGIAPRAERNGAHVGTCDVMPTLCELLGFEMPRGVQGRSLAPILKGEAYPEDEFASIYVEHGFGGLTYDESDTLDPVEEGALRDAGGFDCLNTWTQAGHTRIVRRGEYKLWFDAQGRGQLYNVVEDPAELNDLYQSADHRDIRHRLMEDMITWSMRVQDPLPYPHRRYVYKRHERNYWRG